jgi:hypothetical protein
MTTDIAVDFGLDFDDTGHVKWFNYDDPYKVEVGDSRYVLTMGVDQFYSAPEFINDCDESIYGRVSKYAYDYWRDGNEPRPDGFTGRARKVQVDRGYWMWWEPPATLWVNDTEVPFEQAGDEATKLTRQVCDLLEGGVHYVTVERQERCSMGHWHTVDSAACGGVDRPYRELIDDLIQEATP